jgi:hypothetical protein
MPVFVENEEGGSWIFGLRKVEKFDLACEENWRGKADQH